MDTLDVKGLPKEKVSYLQQLIEQWRKEAAQIETGENNRDEDIVFATHKSDVLGPITRREIYDYLS